MADRVAAYRNDWRTPRREEMEREIASLQGDEARLLRELAMVRRELRWRRVHVKVYLTEPS